MTSNTSDTNGAPRANDTLATGAEGVLGAWAFVGVRLLVLIVGGYSQVSSIWELQTGVAGLLPMWLLLALLPGLLGGLIARMLLRAELRTARRDSLWVASGSFLFGSAVAWGVGGGRHLATLASRGGFSLVVGCVAAVLTYFTVPLCIAFLHRTPRGRRPRDFAWVALLAVIVSEVVNGAVLTRLYPVFHLALSALSYGFSGFAVVLLLARTPVEEPGPAVSGFYYPRTPSRGRVAIFATGIVVALACLLLVPASRMVQGFDNFRWLVQEGSPSLAWAVEVSSHIAPPPPLDETLAAEPLGERRSKLAVDFRGRDILLISVDALRADHLGAYGYEPSLTPEMDALAAEGVLFEAAYAATPHTSYSVTSLMTGKYMRPLLLQNSGTDSQLWASLLQEYDYRTAAFYPPAIFFIDTPRFLNFQRQNLGFEYSKIEFAEGDRRVGQVKEYLDKSDDDHRIFMWVHLFGPHEPYEKQPGHEFGSRDIDLYDGEVAAADETLGRVVRLARARDPRTLVIVTADHGEEFGDHGGRYHGTSVFDEQVRVPLIIAGEGLAQGTRVAEPVQTIDLLPTVLEGLKIPVPPRVRGRSLTQFLDQKGLEHVKEGDGTAETKLSSSDTEGVNGRAFSETDDYTLLAQGIFRLICQRRSGACQLFNTQDDPRQVHDISAAHRKRVEAMRRTARALAETHGKYESQGLRAEGQGWPSAILLGISGNAEVAPSLALLLDDADAGIRRKAAELLFTLGTSAQAPALRLALTREEDEEARVWIALALTSLGQGAPLVHEILKSGDLQMRRLAALALAEQGDDAGEKILSSWWYESKKIPFEMARRVLEAFSTLKSKETVPFLIRSLKDSRLRADVAATLAEIGDKDALPHLAAYLLKERYHSIRLPLAEAMVQLGGDDELIVPLRRFLGVPDGMPGGLALARRAGILHEVGGPKPAERARLEQLSDSGVKLTLIVPGAPKGERAVRLIVQVRSRTGAGGTILVQPSHPRIYKKDSGVRVRYQPVISPETSVKIEFAPAESLEDNPDAFQELMVTLPPSFGAKPGHHLGLELFAPQDIEVSSIAAVALREDLPPPAPEAWDPKAPTLTH